jgi:SHS2 domain-containing protein
MHWAGIPPDAQESSGFSRKAGESMPSLKKHKTHYRLINHTADFGIRVFGRTKRDLFQNAGYALFDLIVGKIEFETEKIKIIYVQGEDLADLMVNWLRELLYVWSGADGLVSSVEVIRISPKFLQAAIGIVHYDPEHHQIQNEIKAVTYHQIQVNRTLGGWNSQIIFDV